MARLSMLLAGAALAVLAVFSAAAGASEVVIGRQLLQDPLEFPPLCKCNRDPDQSPYYLTLNPPVSDSGFNKFCFKIANDAGCDPKLTCCNGQGVEKVEFQVVTICKDSLRRVTVDGNSKSFEYNTKLKVLRITNLGKTAATAPGTEVCLFLKSNGTACPTLNKLCDMGGACRYSIFNEERDCCPVNVVGSAPPPPSPFPPRRPFIPAIRLSPPPPSAFPWCNCQRESELSSLIATRSSVTPVGNLTKACFKVDVKADCAPGSPCCQFDLYKLEIDAKPECASSLAYYTLNGVKRSRFFQTRPYPVIKATSINAPFADAKNTEVCFFLKPPCNSLEKLCTGTNGKCSVSLFNKPGSSPSCCPISTV